MNLVGHQQISTTMIIKSEMVLLSYGTLILHLLPYKLVKKFLTTLTYRCWHITQNSVPTSLSYIHKAFREHSKNLDEANLQVKKKKEKNIVCVVMLIFYSWISDTEHCDMSICWKCQVLVSNVQKHFFKPNSFIYKHKRFSCTCINMLLLIQIQDLLSRF